MTLLDYARKEQAVIVCFDSDFHRLLAMTLAGGPSVIRLRIDEMDFAAIADVIQRVVEQVGDALRTGAAVSVSEHRVRVHHLPIGLQ